MKRFYAVAGVIAAGNGWQVALDGRGIKTQGGRPQVVPSQTLAEALADEWHGQGADIDPARFVLRDMADFAIDLIAPDREAAIGALMRFAESDTLCYRADAGDALHARQTEVWEPLLLAAEARYDVLFTRIDGITHRPQPAEMLTRLRAALHAQDDFALSALNTLASLAASLVIGLAALEPEAQPETLWTAANLEEDWQADLWGKDWEAEDRRAKRLAIFSAAMDFARLARS